MLTASPGPPPLDGLAASPAAVSVGFEAQAARTRTKTHSAITAVQKIGRLFNFILILLAIHLNVVGWGERRGSWGRAFYGIISQTGRQENEIYIIYKNSLRF